MSTSPYIHQFLLLTKRYFGTYLGIAIAIFLFLLFFQPFSVDKFEFENKLLFLAGFGVIVLLLMLIAQVLFQASLLEDEEQRRGNAIQVPLYFLVLIVSTSLAFTFYIRYVGQSPIFFITVVKTLFIAISLPLTFFLKYTLTSYQVRLKSRSLENRLLQEQLNQLSENYAEKHIEITSDNGADNLRLKVADVVYAKSADNYVEIGYNDQGVVKKKMLRNTLRNVEQHLSEFTNFTRTHRTSIVNTHYVEKLNKNFNTYWLSLENTKETIPVSRQYLMAVKDQI